ncbi:MAG: 3-phenylpropionate/cinnamic acid dioxygenase subunit beta [Gammaproteobacteria bacterium]|uniref:3-phenylpropionate/cinnamic acid dioxygenase subunit beta n=1 Tax=Pseudomaricurvus alcaniphilus TaxID=1166482 RepID=UPI001407DFBE|nr:3-phenylpropionate/cinnamic acid dioxygenase subunit beta [Pseudomaricurvus alcaniphilus]MBR9909344.1 3-phenylpropionate/cinnamic acid dioxygenase subunit beta [Gammaproteobacteria bacterium]NHN38280.1 3-phenylpropionate/cinnamic acid dioxygenase subunit beta [Pseudomaricurvus alcaniphilus]
MTNTTNPTAELGNSVGIGSEIYNQVLQHYYSEALLLDHIRLKEWGATLAQDLKYTVPVRQTRTVQEIEESYIRSVMHMDDDYGSIMGRIMRLSGKSAWSENPPSRIRRFVSNVQVFETDKADEFASVNYLLITRNRFDDDFFDLIPCQRNDVLRVAGDGFQLVRREVLIDQALLGTPNLSIFL